MNDNTHLITVAVPLLNEVNFVKEALDSLLVQEFQQMQVLIIDGGSTDGTIDIIQSFPFEYVVKPGMGQMAAINMCWQSAVSEYVTWMAGDDRLKPGAFQRLIDEIQKHPEVGVVHAEADIIDAQGKMIGHLTPGDIQFKDLAFEFTMIPQTALIRRKVLEKSGMMDENRRFVADYDLFLRIAQYYPFRFIPFTAAEFRIHNDSEDAKNPERLPQGAIDIFSNFYNRKDLTQEQISYRDLSLTGAYLFAGTTCCMVGKRREAWKWLIKALKTKPKVPFTTRRGLGLIFRLFVPLKFKPFQLRLFFPKLINGIRIRFNQKNHYP